MCSEYKYDGASLTELAKASFGGGGGKYHFDCFFFCLFVLSTSGYFGFEGKYGRVSKTQLVVITPAKKIYI